MVTVEQYRPEDTFFQSGFCHVTAVSALGSYDREDLREPSGEARDS